MRAQVKDDSRVWPSWLGVAFSHIMGVWAVAGSREGDFNLACVTQMSLWITLLVQI